MIKRLVEWWKDRRAALALSDQFASKTGYPLPFSNAEGRKFRLSGRTAHQWLIGEKE